MSLRKKGNLLEEIMTKKSPSMMKATLYKTKIQQTQAGWTLGYRKPHWDVVAIIIVETKLLKTKQWEIHISSPELQKYKMKSSGEGTHGQKKVWVCWQEWRTLGMVCVSLNIEKNSLFSIVKFIYMSLNSLTPKQNILWALQHTEKLHSLQVFCNYDVMYSGLCLALWPLATLIPYDFLGSYF